MKIIGWIHNHSIFHSNHIMEELWIMLPKRYSSGSSLSRWLQPIGAKIVGGDGEGLAVESLVDSYG